jgi:hypothetical protein
MRLPARPLLAALLALAACSDGVAPGDNATFSGVWASRPWRGSGSAFLVSGGTAGDTLYILGRTPPDAGQPATQSIRLRVAPYRGAGAYQLAPDAVEVMDLVGGDVIATLYVGRGPVAGTLDVVRAEGVGQEIVGLVRFTAEHSYGDATYGPSASFESGQYRTLLLSGRQ